MKLLTAHNPKAMKGEKKGYMTFLLHLAPASLSGYNVCASSSAGCRAACLNTAGRGGIFKHGEKTNKIQEARLRKTKLFFENRAEFMEMLRKDISAAILQAWRRNLTAVFRLNATSDIRWEKIPALAPIRGEFPNIFAMFPGVQFYDYTKHINRTDIPANYHLTFSRSECNDADVMAAIAKGMNVAVVFADVPKVWNGIPVINGDETDLRFLDPSNVIVGLKTKGKAKKDTTGFVV